MITTNRRSPGRARPASLLVTAALAALAFGQAAVQAQGLPDGGMAVADAPLERDQPQPACDADNAGLTLPPGFCALVVAENVGFALARRTFRTFVHQPAAMLGVLDDAGMRQRAHRGGTVWQAEVVAR